MMKTRFWLTGLLCAACLVRVSAEPIIVDLWPDGAPNDNELTGEEYRDKAHRITNVTKPTLTVFVAPKPNGMAVIACPGGAYRFLSFEHEGTDMAQWYNEQGITLAVLKYRMPNGHMECPQSDIKKAMELMHAHADEWGLDHRKIGVQGASAGGNLAAWLSSHYENDWQRPGFQVLFYGAVSMGRMRPAAEANGQAAQPAAQAAPRNDWNVGATTSPAFIMVSADDNLCMGMCVQYFQALQQNKVAMSCLHVYPDGGHGWGFNDSFAYKSQWTQELSFWLEKMNTFLETPETSEAK